MKSDIACWVCLDPSVETLMELFFEYSFGILKSRILRIHHWKKHYRITKNWISPNIKHSNPYFLLEGKHSFSKKMKFCSNWIQMKNMKLSAFDIILWILPLTFSNVNLSTINIQFELQLYSNIFHEMRRKTEICWKCLNIYSQKEIAT